MHWRRRQQGSRLRSRPPLDLGPEPHSTRSGPARPDPRPRQLSGLRGVGTPDPETFAGGRGREARTQGPGPARGVRPRSPRARARTARRVRGALPGPARKLAQNKSKSSGRQRGARWRGEDAGRQGAPVQPACGACGTPPPLPGAEEPRAPRSAPQTPSPDCSVSGAAAADTRAGRPQAPALRSPAPRY